MRTLRAIGHVVISMMVVWDFLNNDMCNNKYLVHLDDGCNTLERSQV